MSRPTVLLMSLAMLLVVAWWQRSAEPVHASGPRDPGRWTKMPPESGVVAGRLTVDPEVPASSLSVELSLRVDAADFDLFLPLEVDASGFYSGPELPPGKATLSVRAGGTVLAEREEVVVRANERREIDFDLRGEVCAFEFRLEDVDGVPPARAVVGWRPAVLEDEAPAYERWAIAREGVVTLVDGAPVIDLLVLAQGTASLELRGVSTSRVIPLPEAWSARVELPDGVDPAEDGTHIEVVPRPAQRDHRIARDSSTGGEFYQRIPAVPFEGRFARLDLPDAGPWILEWRAWRGEDRIELGSATATVRLALGNGSEVLRPEFPADAYRRSLRD